MTHSDNNGLVLPPAIAPIQVVVVPVAQHKPGVLEKAQELQERLSEKFRVKLDASDNSPGWKFAEYEMKGVARPGGDRPQGHGEGPVRHCPPGQR